MADSTSQDNIDDSSIIKIAVEDLVSLFGLKVGLSYTFLLFTLFFAICRKNNFSYLTQNFIPHHDVRVGAMILASSFVIYLF